MAPAVVAAGPSTPLTMLSDPEKHFTAWVTIDDKPMPVCKVVYGERKTTCYIEAVEGKEYQVKLVRNWPATDVLASLWIDGVRVLGRSFAREPHLTKESAFKDTRISPTEVRPFVFATMPLTDDAEEATTSEQVIKNLGTVQMNICRVTRVGLRARSSGTYTDCKQHVVDERSKKATMSHSTAFGEAKQRVRSSTERVLDWIDRSDSPFYTLEFKYRSRALLELEDIVAPPAPPASPSPRPVASTFAGASGSGSSSPVNQRKKRRSSATALEGENEDLRAKIARLEAENSQLQDAGVKREDGGEGDVKPRVKGEPIGKVSTENGRTVIDLLDEDG